MGVCPSLAHISATRPPRALPTSANARTAHSAHSLDTRRPPRGGRRAGRSSMHSGEARPKWSLHSGQKSCFLREIFSTRMQLALRRRDHGHLGKISVSLVETGNRNSFVCADIAEPYAHNVACPSWHLSCPRKPKTARHRSRGHQEHPRDERFNAVTTSYSPSSQAPASPRNRCSKKNRQFGISTFYFSGFSLQPLKTNATRHPSSLTPS